MSHTSYLLSDQQLIEVLSLTKHPTAIHVSEDAIIQAANDAMIKVWGKDKSVIGKTLEDALPELKGQPFIDMFKRVWNEGITIEGTDTPAELLVDGELQIYYFDFEYRAIKNAAGQTYAIIHSATDVTERYLTRQREQSLIEELSAANEELSASNEEIMASNEELASINEELLSTTEELSNSHEQLKNLNDDLFESEDRFRNLITQAPVGICVIRADDLMVQEVNDAYLELVRKERKQVEHLSIWDAVPEAQAHYAPIMQEVISSGIPFVGSENELKLVRNGEEDTVYINFVYQPVFNDEKVVEAIMVVGFEVTEQVISRQLIQVAEERSRLAVEAAEIGIFDLDLHTGIPTVSGRFNTIFGIEGPVGNKTINSIVHPDDRETRLNAHKEALISGTLYYEARVIHKDGSLHWFRAQGKVLYNEHNQPVRMLGTVLDVTAYKELQQQKDDFISIASHELKTPITSLKASLQLIDKIKDNPSKDMMPRLIMQSRKSVERVSILVDDLLNVSRLQQTEIQLNKSYFILSQLLNTIVNPFSITSKIKFSIIGELELQVFADEHRIDQVVTNLVTNVAKYAPNSETVTLAIEKNNDTVKVSVTDQGQGIPAEKIPHLFDRYYRVDSSGNHASGLGLGLYICSEIIKRHGGQMGVESELGQGSMFWFTLPLSAQ